MPSAKNALMTAGSFMSAGIPPPEDMQSMAARQSLSGVFSLTRSETAGLVNCSSAVTSRHRYVSSFEASAPSSVCPPSTTPQVLVCRILYHRSTNSTLAWGRVISPFSMSLS